MSNHKSKSSKRHRKQSAEARAFINGTADKVTLRPRTIKTALGPEYVLSRGSGTGAHGKVGRARNRAERKSARQQLRAE